MTWPNEKLNFCGAKDPTRVCDKKSKNPLEKGMLEDGFCFT